MGEANLVAGTVRELDEWSIELETALGEAVLPVRTVVPDGVRRGDRVTLCFRPEHVASGQDRESVIDMGQAVVADTAFFGTHHRVLLTPERSGRLRVVAHLPQTRTVAPGDRVRVRVKASMAVVLAAEED